MLHDAGRRRLATEALRTRVDEAAAHWLGPRYSARTTYFGKWHTYLRRSQGRAARQGVCAAQGPTGGGRETIARGLAGGGRTGANVPRPKRHGIPVQGVPHAQAPSLRPGCRRHREPPQHRAEGAVPYHFFTTKRGPSLLSFSTSISSSSFSAILPRCELPPCEPPVSRTAVGAGQGLLRPRLRSEV